MPFGNQTWLYIYIAGKSPLNEGFNGKPKSNINKWWSLLLHVFDYRRVVLEIGSNER